jgi:hypothetical protein
VGKENESCDRIDSTAGSGARTAGGDGNAPVKNSASDDVQADSGANAGPDTDSGHYTTTCNHVQAPNIDANRKAVGSHFHQAGSNDSDTVHDSAG